MEYGIYYVLLRENVSTGEKTADLTLIKEKGPVAYLQEDNHEN